MNKFLCCTLVFLDISVKWTIQELPPRKYLHYDRTTSRELMCDECPPGTYVKKPCTDTSVTECAPCKEDTYNSYWDNLDECNYCNIVCMELQLEVVPCSSTHNRVCECIEGWYFLDGDYCSKHKKCPPGFGVVQPGTPHTDTVCERCSEGYFSQETSSTAACQKHTDCNELGHTMVQEGTATHDTVCEEPNTEKLEQQCDIDVTLCEEAFFRSAVPTKPTPNWLNTLTESLPGTRVSAETIERIKQGHSPQEQTFQLLKLWKQQNKDHNMVKNIIQGIDLCEMSVSKHIGHLNLTSEQLNILMENLPGKKVEKEEIEQVLNMCKSTKQFLKFLSLWRIKNKDQDTIKGLTYGLKNVKSYHFPKTAIQGLRKVVKFLHSPTTNKLYQKLFAEMVGNKINLVKVRRG